MIRRAAFPLSGLVVSLGALLEYNRQRGLSSSTAAQCLSSRFPYVILGSGTAAHAALEALKLGDPHASILMIAEATSLPRVDVGGEQNEMETTNHVQPAAAAAAPNPLEAMLGEVFNEWRRQLSSGLDESSEGVTLIKATERMRIDVEDRVITLSDGSQIKYKKCLLATAGKPREFYVLDKDKIRISKSFNEGAINTLHSALDFRNLARLATSPDRRQIVVVGGGAWWPFFLSPPKLTTARAGFLGTEVVAALAAAGSCKVTHVMGEPTALAQYLPEYLSTYVTEQLIALGVDSRGEALLTGVRPGSVLTRKQNGAMQEEDTLSVTLVGAERVSLDTDCVVLASTSVQPDLMGLDNPNTGLEVVDGGLCTNSSLEAFNGFFVAGNAATYYDPHIGRRRVDTYDHAVNSGMWAALNMMAAAGLCIT
jgi:programmed cell death 8 (apoptosis-inducing factor)